MSFFFLSWNSRRLNSNSAEASQKTWIPIITVSRVSKYWNHWTRSIVCCVRHLEFLIASIRSGLYDASRLKKGNRENVNYVRWVVRERTGQWYYKLMGSIFRADGLLIVTCRNPKSCVNVNDGTNFCRTVQWTIHTDLVNYTIPISMLLIFALSHFIFDICSIISLTFFFIK